MRRQPQCRVICSPTRARNWRREQRLASTKLAPLRSRLNRERFPTKNWSVREAAAVFATPSTSRAAAECTRSEWTRRLVRFSKTRRRDVTQIRPLVIDQMARVLLIDRRRARDKKAPARLRLARAFGGTDV